MLYIKDFLVGFVIGLANLIPGVSGGTFALIFGVYERLISFVNSLGLSLIKELWRLIKQIVTSRFSCEARNDFYVFLQERDFFFIFRFTIGMICCIFLLSSLMKYLILNHFEPTYAFFFGLILVSVVIPLKLVKKIGPVQIASLLLGVALTVLVAASVNPHDKVFGKAEMNKDLYEKQQISETKTVAPTGKFQFIGKYSTGEYLYVALCGAIAISAMVLPGVSGSLVMILMGVYFGIVSAVANVSQLLLDDLIYLGVFTLGIIVGILVFSRLIEWMLERYHDTMISFLIGLIAGSLYPLWPFKEFVVIDNYVKQNGVVVLAENFKSYTNINMLPGSGDLLIPAFCMVAGIIVMLFFLKKEE